MIRRRISFAFRVGTLPFADVVLSALAARAGGEVVNLPYRRSAAYPA
jgi:hypothetical protein